jgi:hypothetical protein
MNKMNKINEFKGKRYSATVERNGQPFSIGGTVLESYNFLCLVEMDNISNVGTFKEHGLYNLVEDSDGVKSLVPTNDTYGDDQRKGGSNTEVKARFDKKVSLIIAKEKQERAKTIKTAEQLERAKTISSNVLKLKEAHDLKYKAISDLKIMVSECNSIESLLKDKKALALFQTILMTSALSNNFNSQIFRNQ